MRASCLQSRRLCIGSRHCGHELSLRRVGQYFSSLQWSYCLDYRHFKPTLAQAVPKDMTCMLVEQ